MNLEASRIALSHLHEIRLLNDKEHATAFNEPKLANAPLRTPAEALAWDQARAVPTKACVPIRVTQASAPVL